MNDQHDWVEAYRAVGQYLRDGKLKRNPGQLFCLDHAHNDGAVVVLGRDCQPLYLVVASHGLLENENLLSFIGRMQREFTWMHILGNTDSQPPWYVICALTATDSLSQAERDDLESRFEMLIQKLKERFKKNLTDN